MNNPWNNLPKSMPFVLPEDRVAIERFNVRHRGKSSEVLLDQLPSPYVGDPCAPVVILNLNPAYSIEIASEASLLLCEKMARANISHEFFEYPFYPLDPQLAGVSAAGHEWWSKRCLGDLIRESGLPAREFSRHIFCAEYFPYHSRKYGWIGEVLPSVRYTISIVEKAVERGALFIIMWGNGNKRAWLEAVPVLASADLVTLRSAQNPKISRGNLAEGEFERIVTRISAL
ncbi:MAG: hypothetical protein Q8P17_04240 [bacterium]|nr:hypothetical protein [bacterium]